MSHTKTKKGATPMVQCQNCSITILSKDVDNHLEDCPVNYELIKYDFIKDETLFGTLDLKTNEDIKVEDKENLVFLSETVIRACSLAIGDWATLKFNNSVQPVAKIVWPTIEKSLTSALITKNALDLMGVNAGTPVIISKLAKPPPEARAVTLLILNGPKSMEIGSELNNRIHKQYLSKLLAPGNRISVRFFGKLLKLEVKTIENMPSKNLEDSLDTLSINEQFSLITNATSWKLFGSEAELSVEESPESLLSKIGGLEPEIGEILASIRLALDPKPHGLKHGKSILLFGHSGTGKTMLATAIAKASCAHFIPISAADLYTHPTNIDETIRNRFADAIHHSPSIILLDDVDILCPIRSQRLSDTDRRTVAALLTSLDTLAASRVFILATTNKPDSIDPIFRRCGRFDRELEIPTPSPRSRLQILEKLLEGVAHTLTSSALAEVGNRTHGFVGADLVSLVVRASLNAALNEGASIGLGELRAALKHVGPSAMREVQVEVADVRWGDIGGQAALKLALKQAVEWPLRHPESFLRLGVTPPKGVLMFGPPGCSKTMVAKALATESGLNFLSIKGPELFSKWVGDSERAVREVFRRARRVAPAVVFFDEIDALGGERGGAGGGVQERVLAQLLTELDGVTPLGDVTVLAATNRPDRIDKALLRPGRLDRIVYVPLPDEGTRRDIFRLRLGRMAVRGVAVEGLVAATEGYSGAEVNAVCHEAGMMALEESLGAEWVEERHFERALELVTPRTPKTLIKLYEDYLNKKIK